METPGNRSGDEGIFKRLDPRDLLALGLSGQTEPFNPEQLPADPRASFKPESPADVIGPVNLSQLPELSFREESPGDREGSVTVSDKAGQADSPSTNASDVTPPTETYAFVLGRVIGRGGMAEVREAQQVSLGRTVAVKRPTVSPDTSQEQALIEKDLFAREAVITARLEHPNVVPVHDLGQGPNGLPMLAMKLVHGTRWPDLLYADRHLGTRERLAKHLPILIDVAQAVAFAHERRIIHRDLKPGQVMVGRHGEVYLMDWGLAVSFERGDAMAESGSQVTALAAVASTNAPNPAGTPAYMAPEQTERTGLRLGPWTDVWLLGAVLYDVLTGTPPYQDDHSILAFGAAARGEVEPPESRVGEERAATGEIPPELSQLCMACLQPGIGDRIVSAEVFIEQIKAYQSGATRREESRALTAQATAILDAVSTGPNAAGLSYDDLEECDRKLSRALSLDPENIDAAAGKQRVISELAHVALSGGDLKLARVQAGRLADEHRRGVLLMQITIAETRSRRQRAQRVAAMAMSGLLIIVVAAVALFSRARIADALHIAEVARDDAKTAREHGDTVEGEVRAVKDRAVYDLYVSNVGLAQREVEDEHFTRAEEALLAAPAQHRGWEWGYLMAAAHPELMQYRGHSLSVNSVAFSPDGRRLASASQDGTVRTWDVFSGREIRRLAGHREGVKRVRWSPDGRTIATASADGTAALWDAETGRRQRILEGHSGTVEDVRFTSSGLQVATLASDAHLRFFDTGTGIPVRDFDIHADRAFAFDLSPDGHLAAVGAGLNGGVLLDLDRGTTIGQFKSEAGGGEAKAVSFSPVGDRFAVTSRGNASFVWNVLDNRLLTLLSPPVPGGGAYGYVSDLHWLTGGSALVGSFQATLSPCVAMWSLAALTRQSSGSNVQSKRLTPPTGRDFNSVDVSPDGRYVAVASDRAIYLYAFEQERYAFEQDAMANPRELRTNAADSNHALRWLPGKREIIFAGQAVVGDGRGTIARDLPTTTVLCHSIPGEPTALAVAPDGLSVAVAARREGFIAGSPATGRGLFNIPLSAESDDACSLAYSSDSEVLATICCSHPQPHKPTLDLWSVRDGHHLHTCFIGKAVSPSTAAFSPDGHHLAIGTSNGRLILTDYPSEELEFDVQAGADRINAMAFSPDGRSIALACGLQVLMFETSNGARLMDLPGHASLVQDVAFSPDGRRLATASLDQTIGVWDADTGRALNFLKGHFARVWQAQWAYDGLAIATASTQRRILIWEAKPWLDDGNPGDAADDKATTAAWDNELRNWQAARFERYEVAHELEKLPNAYWGLDRLAVLGPAAVDDEYTTMSAALFQELANDAQENLKTGLANETRGFAIRTEQLQHEFIGPAWQALHVDVERAYLAGRTREQVEFGWHQKIAGDTGPATSVTSILHHSALTQSEHSIGSRFALPLHPIGKNNVIGEFGYNRYSKGEKLFNQGIDLAAKAGTKIIASDGGTIIWSGWRGAGLGYCVIIDHHNHYTTLYGSCSLLIADVGDNVRRGDLIAKVGSTGLSANPHLHFEIRKDDQPVDPKRYLPEFL